MGLDTSHDCWHGSYSGFMRWREAVAAAAGLPELRRMEGFGEEEGIAWDAVNCDPALKELLHHSDCDGEIPAASCAPIADALEALLPNTPNDNPFFSPRNLTEKFIAGLRLAASKGEPVDFH